MFTTYLERTNNISWAGLEERQKVVEEIIDSSPIEQSVGTMNQSHYAGICRFDLESLKSIGDPTVKAVSTGSMESRLALSAGDTAENK